MSDLETIAQPLLTPLILGNSVVVGSEVTKRVIATWGLKTMMMLQFAKADQWSPIPPAHYQFLRTYQRPPQQVEIWIGHYLNEPNDPRPRRIWQDAIYVAFPLEAYFVTMLIGNLVFHFFGHVLGDEVRLRDYTHVRFDPEKFTLPLWPIREGVIEWPPPFTYDRLTIDAFLRDQTGPLDST
jgi:hypothetical protein